MRELTALELAKIESLVVRKAETMRTRITEMLLRLTVPLGENDVILYEDRTQIGVGKRELLSKSCEVLTPIVKTP